MSVVYHYLLCQLGTGRHTQRCKDKHVLTPPCMLCPTGKVIRPCPYCAGPPNLIFHFRLKIKITCAHNVDINVACTCAGFKNSAMPLRNCFLCHAAGKHSATRQSNNIFDWIYENHSKSHIWYFEKYQFEIFMTL